MEHSRTSAVGILAIFCPKSTSRLFQLVPVLKCFTGGTVNEFYRFLPVYRSTNCPPYLRRHLGPLEEDRRRKTDARTADDKQTGRLKDVGLVGVGTTTRDSQTYRSSGSGVVTQPQLNRCKERGIPGVRCIK